MDPFSKIVKEVNGFFKPYTDRIDAIKAALEDKMRIWQRAELARREEAERKRKEEEARIAAEKAKAAEALAETTGKEVFLDMAIGIQEEAAKRAEKPIVAKNTAHGGMGTTSTIRKWKFEITDPAAVPREWCCPDEQKIREAVCKKDGIREIPGLRIRVS